MKTLKTLLITTLFTVSSDASAMVDSVKLLVSGKDGKTSEDIVKLEQVSPDTMRLTIAFKKYPRNRWLQIDHIDIISDDATARKGDAGYWVLSDGRLGEFTHDDGQIIEPRNPMQMYGVKKGDEAFVAIVKGLKYECTMFVEAKEGAYKVFPRFEIAQIGMPIYELHFLKNGRRPLGPQE